jgi:CheY-like chemotaxis protein
MSDSHSSCPFEVLLVEDNPGDVRLVREAFREGGMNVHLTVASDGEEALAVLRREGSFAALARPALILLDLNLPRMSGRELLAAIKADEGLRRIPVVVLTSSRREQDILASYDLNANSCITKPANLEQFMEVVRSIEQFWLKVATLPPGG